jgi:hypothetical protein
MHLRTAMIAERRGDLAEAETHLRRAEALLVKLLGAAHPKAAQARVSLGRVLVAAGKAAEAEPILVAGVEAYDESAAATGWQRALAHAELAACYAATGDRARAAAELETARAKFDAAPGDMYYPAPGDTFAARAEVAAAAIAHPPAAAPR